MKSLENTQNDVKSEHLQFHDKWEIRANEYHAIWQTGPKQVSKWTLSEECFVGGIANRLLIRRSLVQSLIPQVYSNSFLGQDIKPFTAPDGCSIGVWMRVYEFLMAGTV